MSCYMSHKNMIYHIVYMKLTDSYTQNRLKTGVMAAENSALPIQNYSLNILKQN